MDGAQHAGAPDAGAVFDAEAAEFAGDQAGGAVLLERQFGVGVQVAPDIDQARLGLARQTADGGADVVDVAHHWLPRRIMR